jgi:hypothetical protein
MVRTTIVVREKGVVISQSRTGFRMLVEIQVVDITT